MGEEGNTILLADLVEGCLPVEVYGAPGSEFESLLKTRFFPRKKKEGCFWTLMLMVRWLTHRQDVTYCPKAFGGGAALLFQPFPPLLAGSYGCCGPPMF